ncbi:restriction endonuclease subunit S [Burkholderia gladioli]|uniref:restriction endonuclease subunit S n=1 Tax=Burkholderia gladioli TaxID=28095 RepID=UPI00163F5820|nr:restriction endonuclease subunit S [Burkholderia gladioli]
MSVSVSKLRDVLEVQNGFAFKTEFFSDTNGIPVIRIRDLGAKHTETRYFGDYRDEFLVSPGDYLIGMDGSFRCRKWEGPQALLNQRVCRLHMFSPHVLPEYVYYGIQPKLDAIEASTPFATVKHISARQILDIELHIPSLDEQRRIVDLLSRAEGIVRLRREAQVKAQAIIPSLFVDMFGDPATNPKGWSKCPLVELICSGPTNGLYKHKSLYGRGTPILRIDAFYSGKVKDLNALKRVELESDIELKRFELRQGDIVINRVNSPEYLGKSAIIPELQEPIVFESNMMRLSVNRARILPEFVIAQLQQPAARNHFLANAKHAINQSSINQQDVKSLLMIVPPLAAQAKYVEWSTNANSILMQQEEALLTAEQTFASILAKSFEQ